jgi:SAM-dependent methyltransferase
MSEDAIRKQYEEHGAQGYYEQFGAIYRNPHEPIITDVIAYALATWPLETSHVVDLACGSGEVTLALRAQGVTDITGIDPYTGAAYTERTGQVALPYRFEDIASGALTETYSLIVCSFAMHLVEESRLPMLCYALASLAPDLVILTPHKRPQIKASWGWRLRDEIVIDRVRARWYHSTRDDSLNE